MSRFLLRPACRVGTLRHLDGYRPSQSLTYPVYLQSIQAFPDFLSLRDMHRHGMILIRLLRKLNLLRILSNNVLSEAQQWPKRRSEKGDRVAPRQVVKVTSTASYHTITLLTTVNVCDKTKTPSSPRHSISVRDDCSPSYEPLNPLSPLGQQSRFGD